MHRVLFFVRRTVPNRAPPCTLKLGAAVGSHPQLGVSGQDCGQPRPYKHSSPTPPISSDLMYPNRASDTACTPTPVGEIRGLLYRCGRPEHSWTGIYCRVAAVLSVAASRQLSGFLSSPLPHCHQKGVPRLASRPWRRADRPIMVKWVVPHPQSPAAPVNALRAGNTAVLLPPLSPQLPN
jgi:hypothetical protein